MTQTRLHTGNNTGWQSRPSTYTKETTNFVITRHSTNTYSIKPKETKPRSEVNNINQPPTNDTAANQTNADTTTTSAKSPKPPRKPKYGIRQLSATLQLNRKDRMLYVPFQLRSTRHRRNPKRPL